MRKVVALSLVTTAMLFANDTVDLPTVNVEGKINSKVVKDISSTEIKSADLAEALSQNVPSISLVRRSGIANDIILRGAKKDNINVLLDHGKIYGACPNRMDPATSHVLTNNIESVEVIEGPFDVENFGTLSGLVKVNMKEPSEEFGGDVNINFGSFGYQKQSVSIEGGTDKFKLLISASKEESGQYKDGDGNDFSEQQVENGTPTGNQYSKDNLDAYEKKTLMAKTIINVTDDSELALAYTANRSDDILYPNTPMDADYDDSDIFTLDYTLRNLGEYSKELVAQYYYSEVDHPMSTRLRNNAGMSKNKTNHMKSSIWGAKVKNGFDLGSGYLSVGLDTSKRNWKGKMTNDDKTVNYESLPSTDTTNKALFSTYEETFGKLALEFGMRYDHTKVEVDDASRDTNTYKNLGGNIFGTYSLTDNTKLFGGFGVASRVPDARELHYKSNGTTFVGNQDLEETQNREIDFGIEHTFESAVVKSKVFYSDLKDYIYYQKGTGFQNVDATIYGLDVSAMYMLNDEISIDAGIAYQRGEKDEALNGQTDKDLAEIPPLKGSLGLNYETQQGKFRAEVIASDSWSNYDEDNGEQSLSGYSIVNLKYDHKVTKNFDITLGVDNLFDKTYASTNTYYDITYIGTTTNSPKLLNDPGRYMYVNLRYSF